MDGNKQEKHRFWGAAIGVFERQVLIFPLLVVLLASASFLFGGRCSAWQWWTAVVTVVGAPFLKKENWRAALGAAGLFAGLLAIIKAFLPPLFWDNVACPDMQVYHLPQIQLLIEGWNPVADPLAEGITANLGLDLWGMAPLHVAFLSKTMAIFSAVAYKFVGDPTALTIPGLAFIWLGVAVQAMRQFKGVARWMVLAALIWVLPLVTWHMYVDEVLAFSCCGMLFAMSDALKRGRCDWLKLTVWTTWVATVKLNGLLAVGVFWSLFTGAMLWRNRKDAGIWLVKFALLGATVSALAVLIAWQPFVTSWKTYGHPLYPFSTVDSERHPAKSLTWDIRPAEAVWRPMGRSLLWMHEYIDPQVAGKLFRRQTGGAEYNPQQLTMMREEDFTFRSARLAVWTLFALLLAHPRGRLWGLGGLITTWAVPWQMIGFLRYLPWLSSLGCLAVALWAEDVAGKGTGRLHLWTSCGFVVLFFVFGVRWAGHAARDIAFKEHELAQTREGIRHAFWLQLDQRDPELPDFNPSNFAPRYNYLTAMENQCRLLAKEMGWTKTEVLPPGGWSRLYEKNAMRAARPLWKWDEREWYAPAEGHDVRTVTELGTPWYDGNVWDGFPEEDGSEGWIMTPWRFYYVRWGEQSEHIEEYYLGGEQHAGEGRVAWFGRRLETVARIWGVTYPKEVGKWLIGRGGQGKG